MYFHMVYHLQIIYFLQQIQRVLLLLPSHLLCFVDRNPLLIPCQLQNVLLALTILN